MNGLVLSGGGARSAYQVGILAYIAEKAPEVSFPIVTGVSAGAINAAFLAGARDAPSKALHRLSRCWCELTIERVFETELRKLGVSGIRWIWTLGGAGTSLGPRVRGLVDTEPLREFLEKNLDIEGIKANIAKDRLRALGLTATNYATGRTITFVDGAPDVEGWDRSRRCGIRDDITVAHVMASTALPLVFPAVKIHEDYYGDGSIRQSAPLAPAIHLGANRLLAISTRYAASASEAKTRATEGYPPPAQIISLLFNTVFLDTLEADLARLHRLNRVLRALPAGQTGPDELRELDILVLRPSKDLGKLAGDYEGKLPRSVRLMLRGLGAHRVHRPDLLSYLLFEEPYVSRLIELGYEDALSQWSKIEDFFFKDTASTPMSEASGA